MSVPKSLPSCLLVLTHMLLQPSLCFPSFHELVHTDVIRLLPEIASVLLGIKHLHDSEHSTHSGAWALRLLVMVPHQRNAVMLPPNCHSWMHPRKRFGCTIGECITMLLTNGAQDLKSYNLSAFPRDFPLRTRSPTLVLRCLSTSWEAPTPQTMVPPAPASGSKSTRVALCTLQSVVLSRAKQACQKYPRMPHSLPVGSRLPSVVKWCNFCENKTYVRKRFIRWDKHYKGGSNANVYVCPHKLRKNFKVLVTYMVAYIRSLNIT
jgi:hypothetical protein